MKKGILIFIMGVSGAGKNTILRLLSQSDLACKGILSYKTRPLRPGEVNGVDYHCISKDAFESHVKSGDFLEYAHVYGGSDYYGTMKNDILTGLSEGYILIKEMDIQGIQQIAQNDYNLYSASIRIFLDLPEPVMIQRITSRAPITDEELHRRLLTAVEERALAQQYASTIISAAGTIEEVYHDVYEYIKTFL